MALYVVTTEAGGVLVRARNGNIAREMADEPGADVTRVTEAGPDGVISELVITEQPPEAVDEDEQREVDVTNLSDKGVRRFKNLVTGKERTEPKN